MQQPSNPIPRVVGLDIHPDSFTASLVQGPTPLAAVVLKTFNKVPIAQLQDWAARHTTASDILVLEASGNSFHVARLLRAMDRKALVLESTQLGRLKEAHANNDRISATRIAKAYLSGTARQVWVPDLQTQQRRDWFHAHRKAVKNVTSSSNSLGSYLSDNGVRSEGSLLKLSPEQRREFVFSARSWDPAQRQLLEIALANLEHALQAEARWSSLLAQQVLQDPKLLQLTRLCGIRDVIAFAIGAIVGDVSRFESPKALVKYVGLNPAFDDSGKGSWTGGIGGHGRKDLRALLIEAGHALLRSHNHPNAKWGRQLLARKGEVALVVAALARKLVVQVWYSLHGRSEPLKEITKPTTLKIGKIISRVGEAGMKCLGVTRKSLREQAEQILLSRGTGREYVLRADPAPDTSVAPTRAAGRSESPAPIPATQT